MPYPSPFGRDAVGRKLGGDVGKRGTRGPSITNPSQNHLFPLVRQEIPTVRRQVIPEGHPTRKGVVTSTRRWRVELQKRAVHRGEFRRWRMRKSRGCTPRIQQAKRRSTIRQVYYREWQFCGTLP